MVSILYFETENARDVVTFDGSTKTVGEMVTFVISGTTEVRTIAFNSTSVFVTFISDPTVTYYGFHLRLFANFTVTSKL